MLALIAICHLSYAWQERAGNTASDYHHIVQALESAPVLTLLHELVSMLESICTCYKPAFTVKQQASAISLRSESTRVPLHHSSEVARRCSADKR